MTSLKENPNASPFALLRRVGAGKISTDPKTVWQIPSSDADVTDQEKVRIWMRGYHPQVKIRGATPDSTENLRRRLDNVNNHFRRNAGAVFNDEAALMLLARMSRDFVVQIADFDTGKNGIPLAKLTAANFCEIGENVIYITEAGQKFIASIEAYA